MSKNSILDYSEDPTQNFDLAVNGGLIDGYVDLSVKTVMAHLASANGQIAGQIAFFASHNAPDGWLKANGALLSRSTFANLFATIGTLYGSGDGSTTFQLPDLRGEFIRGLDEGRGVDPSRNLATLQNDEIRSHEHMVMGPPGHTHATEFGALGVDAVFTYIPDSVHGSGGYADIWRAAATGGSETRPRNLAMTACIKY
ncbi:MAG: tail fiber protein [Rhizobiaceae bacterium]|nr:tail fiber protein [Rhizobiaceae bacterium]